ncbi:MAG TPA: ankyrin repeat domain-containing protein [Candidatus Babeliaceae bacterium]|nr:ankyrin repeat domain-containing protein [Candidatus Babeliaceae bacterium]
MLLKRNLIMVALPIILNQLEIQPMDFDKVSLFNNAVNHKKFKEATDLLDYNPELAQPTQGNEYPIAKIFNVLQGIDTLNSEQKDHARWLLYRLLENRSPVSTEHLQAITTIKDQRQRTFLHYATQLENLEQMTLLLKNKAALESKDYLGRTALHYATNKNNLNAVRLLIAQGADVNQLDTNGYAPIHYSVYLDNNEITKLFIKKYALLDLLASDRTVLHQAVYNGNLNTISMLLRAGADPNITDRYGHTPLTLIVEWMCWAAKYYSSANLVHVTYIIKCLIDEGANPYIMNSHGNSPIHIAVREQQTQLVKLMIARAKQRQLVSNQNN